MPESGITTDEQAVEALAAAFESDSESGTPIFEPPAEESAPNFANKPTPPAETPVVPEGSPPEQPAATPPPVAPAAEDSEPAFMDRADLNSLLDGVEDAGARERIERAYKSFQSGFTQARQRESEIVKQYEQLGDPESLQQMAQMRQALQDPGNLLQLYSELGDYLQQGGLVTFDDEPTTPAAPAPDLSAIEDPELAPIKQYVESLRNDMDQLQAQRAQEQQAWQSQQLHNAVVGELQRQENLLRQNHQEWTDADIDAVYELGSFYDGNLLKAAERYDQIVSERISRYLAGKAQAVDTTLPVPNSPTQPPVVASDPERGVTLDDAHKAAMEALRHLEAEG